MRSPHIARRLIVSLALLLLSGALLPLIPKNTYANGNFSLRFHGSGVQDIDRVKIAIDDPTNGLPGPPADIGATDLTIELWLRAEAGANRAAAISCGANDSWINGNIFLDRDRYNQDRKYGLSLGAGRVVFGVSGDGTGNRTICGTSDLRDGNWHHVAVQRRRSDGWLWLFVDGRLEAEADGPDGDISYPDGGTPGSFCGPNSNQPCTNSDPFLVIGAEKHDAGPLYPSFNGWIDELRLSTALRYSGAFARPGAPFAADAQTAALYHFDEGQGDLIGDSSGAAGGPSNGARRVGGNPAGPEWSPQAPWAATPPATATRTAPPATATRTAPPATATRTAATRTPAPTNMPAPHAATSTSAQNRLVNPGFELDENNNGPDYWTRHTSFVRSTDLARSGVYAGRHRSSGNVSYNVNQVVFGITAGTSYQLGGWVNIPPTNDSFTFQLRVTWLRSDNSQVQTNTARTFTTATDGWQEVATTFVAPAGATRARVEFSVSSLNTTVYVDDIMFR